MNTEGKDWMMEKEWVELMVAFYRNVFDEGMNYNQALRQAALAQIELTSERHGHDNPFYWGEFIFSGDPRERQHP